MWLGTWNTQMIQKQVNGTVRPVKVIGGRADFVTFAGLLDYLEALERCWPGLVYQVSPNGKPDESRISGLGLNPTQESEGTESEEPEEGCGCRRKPKKPTRRRKSRCGSYRSTC